MVKILSSIFVIYCILNAVADVYFFTIKELFISPIAMCVLLVCMELIGNIPIMLEIEKKIVFENRCESTRRRYDISMKNVYGSLVIALLPVGVTILWEYYRASNDFDVLSIWVIFILVLPFLLDGILIIFYIIESDNVQKTSSVEKDAEDRIVKELAYEYLGIKKISSLFK